MNPYWCECPSLPSAWPWVLTPLFTPSSEAYPCPPCRGSLPDMNKMLDKEDFTMMKRAIFATQVFGPLSRGKAAPRGPRGGWPS